MNVSKEEKEKWILENCVNEFGYVMLSRLEFPNHSVYLSGMKAKKICNYEQKAERIYNHEQQADTIFNDRQEAGEIYSYNQKAERIYNDYQTIIETKSPLQKKIDELQEKLDELKKQAEKDV